MGLGLNLIRSLGWVIGSYTVRKTLPNTSSVTLEELADFVATMNAELGRSNLFGAPPNEIPANTDLPVISGDSSVGATLTATPGTWTGYPVPTITGRWFRGSTAISGATSSTYTIIEADIGNNIKYQETSTNVAGSVYVDSNAIGPVVPRLLLNTYTALAAYSTRKLSSSYSGPCLRVRNELNDQELDIGFVNGWLDTEAITSFVGPIYRALEVTRYDQSGNGRHITQSTKSLQPQICIGGVVDTNGGLPSSRFDGNWLRYGNSISCAAASSFTVFEETSNSTNYAAWSTNPSKGELWRFAAGGAGEGYMSNFSALRREGFPASGVSGRSLVETYHTGNSMKVYKNGTLLGTNTSQAFESPTELKVGGSESFPLKGSLSELIIFGSDQTANAADIRSNIQSAFFSRPFAAIDLSVSGSSSPFTLNGSGLRSSAGPGKTITKMEWEITLLDQGNRTIGFYGAPDDGVFPWYDSASILQRDSYLQPEVTGTNKQWTLVCTTSPRDANVTGRVNVRLTITNSAGEVATYG